MIQIKPKKKGGVRIFDLINASVALCGLGLGLFVYFRENTENSDNIQIVFMGNYSSTNKEASIHSILADLRYEYRHRKLYSPIAAGFCCWTYEISPIYYDAVIFNNSGKSTSVQRIFEIYRDYTRNDIRYNELEDRHITPTIPINISAHSSIRIAIQTLIGINFDNSAYNKCKFVKGYTNIEGCYGYWVNSAGGRRPARVVSYAPAGLRVQISSGRSFDFYFKQPEGQNFEQ